MLDGSVLGIVLALTVAFLLFHEGVRLTDGQVQGIVVIAVEEFSLERLVP